LVMVLVAEAQINPKTNQLRTFGTAIKNGNLQTTEQTSSNTTAPEAVS